MTSELRSNAGTPTFRAPELLKRWEEGKGHEISAYSPKVDLWSLGCIIFKMVQGEPLFQSDGQVLDETRLRKIVGSIPKKLMSKMKRPCIDFVASLVVIILKERNNTAMALNNRWIINPKMTK